jgi:hypothetical protein
MSEFKGTRGEYFEDNYVSYNGTKTIKVKYSDAQNIDEVLTINGYQRTKKDVEETTKLVLDAFKVRQQINCELSELKEQRDEMLQMLEEVYYTLENEGFTETRNNIKQLIKKV